jgi:hypothetical protein
MTSSLSGRRVEKEASESQEFGRIPSSRMKSRLGWACIALALLLLAISTIGLFQRPEERLRGSRSWDRIDLELDRTTQDYPSLLRYASGRMSGTSENRALALFDVVSRRFVHGLSTESLFTGYPQYLLGGAFRPSFSRDRILRLGNEGFCSQQSYILVQLANDLGLPARQVGLNGHVVAEVWYADDWHMFDPDYELAIRDSAGAIASVAELESDRSLLRAAYGSRNGLAVVPLYQSRIDNNFMSYPPGAYFEWKSNVLLYVTEGLQMFKWAFPLILLVIGGMLVVGQRSQTR